MAIFLQNGFNYATIQYFKILIMVANATTGLFFLVG